MVNFVNSPKNSIGYFVVIVILTVWNASFKDFRLDLSYLASSINTHLRLNPPPPIHELKSKLIEDFDKVNLYSIYLELPERSTVQIHHLQPVGILLLHLAEIFGRLSVLIKLEMALAQETKHPAGTSMVIRKTSRLQYKTTFRSQSDTQILRNNFYRGDNIKYLCQAFSVTSPYPTHTLDHSPLSQLEKSWLESFREKMQIIAAKKWKEIYK